MIAFVAFVVLLGVKYLGEKVKGKFMEQGNSVQSSIAGDRIRRLDISAGNEVAVVIFFREMPHPSSTFVDSSVMKTNVLSQLSMIVVLAFGCVWAACAKKTTPTDAEVGIVDAPACIQRIGVKLH